jgi:hypothetical protein
MGSVRGTTPRRGGPGRRDGVAKDENDEEKCSESTLHGMYLVAQNGEFAGSQGPFAVAGYEVYDGKGKVNGV